MAAKNPSTRNGVKLTPGDIAVQKKLIRKVRTAPALIDVGDIERFETRAQKRDAIRRYMWAIISIPGKDLIERVRADRKYAVMMADVADELHRYHESTSQLMGFLINAEARLMVAMGYRRDMDDVIAEARKSHAPAA